MEFCGTSTDNWREDRKDPPKDMLKKPLWRKEETQERTESWKPREYKISRSSAWSVM